MHLYDAYLKDFAQFLNQFNAYGIDGGLNIMPKRFGCISNTIEINLCEDFTGKKFCSPFEDH